MNHLRVQSEKLQCSITRPSSPSKTRPMISQQLLDNLLEAGFLLEDMMGPGATSTLCRAPLTRASWMGLFRTEASPWARRIDVKVQRAADGSWFDEG